MSDAVIQQVTLDILEQLRRELNLTCSGNSEGNPATSCSAIYECNSTAPSGNYWIRNATIHCLITFSVENIISKLLGIHFTIGISSASNCNNQRTSSFTAHYTKMTCIDGREVQDVQIQDRVMQSVTFFATLYRSKYMIV